jgi:hypothetical protein
MRIIIITIFFISVTFSQNDGYVDSTKVRNPKLAWKMALIPGVGQLYNGKYLKAFGTMGVEYFAIDKFNYYKALEKIGMRNTYAWWILGIYIWSILDSYVDAQLSTFPSKKLESFNELDSLRSKGK